MKIENPYDSKITKIISLLVKTEKQLSKAITDLENSELNTPQEESDNSKLNSIKSESTFEVSNAFNKVIFDTIFTIHKINNVKLKI